jgi:hypothetical protein
MEGHVIGQVVLQMGHRDLKKLIQQKQMKINLEISKYKSYICVNKKTKHYEKINGYYLIVNMDISFYFLLLY